MKKKILEMLAIMLATGMIVSLLVCMRCKAIDTTETYIPYSQVQLCQKYGKQYGIQPEVLMAMIEVESSGRMSATYKNCYGIMQINADVWGWSYDTEEKQIDKACQLLISYDCEIDQALSRYNGQSNPHYDGYVQKVLSRSHALEQLHYQY